VGSAPYGDHVDFADIFNLTPAEPDAFVGIGPRYPWGGLYGGQIVAQALRAAANTVEIDRYPHSLRAYFIRRGDHTDDVRYDVDRTRDGQTFCTRRVVASQAGAAILNAEASFQYPEPSVTVDAVTMPRGLPSPDSLVEDSWTPMYERAAIPDGVLDRHERTGLGRSAMWMRTVDSPGDHPVAHWCAMAYLSDDIPTDAVLRAHPLTANQPGDGHDLVFAVSLDHTIWFHRQLRADEWHLYEMTCHSFIAGRGLSIGHVFAADGTHVATLAQEVLVRMRKGEHLTSGS